MTEIYLLFLQNVTPLFTNFNRFIQKEKPLIYLLQDEMQEFMNKLEARFTKPIIIQDLQQDKKLFSALDISLLKQKDDIYLHIG